MSGSIKEWIMITTGILMTGFGIGYGCLRGKPGNRAIILKSLATCMAAGVGLYAAYHMGSVNGWIFTAGLFFCVAADAVLELNFARGVVIFAAGHVCFIITYIRMAPLKWYTLLCFIALYVGILLLFRRDLAGLSELKELALIYMALLCIMVSTALSVGVNTRDASGWMIAAGAVCFLISDCIIAYRTVKEKKRIIYGVAILLLYYLAVYLFGGAMLLLS